MRILVNSLRPLTVAVANFGGMQRTLERLGRTTARHPWLTIVVWIFAAVALLGVARASGGAFVNECSAHFSVS